MIHPLQARKSPGRSMYSIFLLVILHLLSAWPATLSAQNREYFISGGKRIEISAFNKEIEKMIADMGIPGVSLAIIENNKIAFAGAYGFKRLKTKSRVDKNTVFEACSLSKSYLVYVAFKLVEEGKLDLDKPLYQYVDPGPFLNHDPRYKLITGRMVLSHCSGLENWKEDNNKDTMEILANPGEKFIYSSTGYNYLAAAIEKILNQSYHTYVTEMELKPLHLTHSYLEFQKAKDGTESPSDYATGHDPFGKEIPKWKNPEAIASSANNVTAEDYAKLIIAIFNGKNLSAQSIKTLVSPGIPTNQHGWPNYYGPGFEVFYIGKDTIIAHGGDNPGFKGQVFYSVVNKRGFVFLANSDIGKLMTTRICALTAGLDINTYYRQFTREPYPSPSLDLLRVYREAGPDAMWKTIGRFKQEGRLGGNTLSELGNLFINHDTAIARRLLQQNIALYPDTALAYVYLGDVYDRMERYDSAYDCYTRARDLQFLWWNLDDRIANCERKIKESAKR